MECAQIAGGGWPAGPAVLVGREPELRRMTGMLDAATPGRPSLVVIEGPSGSGRTRLLDEFAAAARRRGVTVVPEAGWLDAAAAYRARRPANPSALLLVSDQQPRWDPDVWRALGVLAGSVPVLVALTAHSRSDAHLIPPEAHRIRLAPLSDGDVERFLGLMVGARPGPELLELSRVAAGRPGALRDLIAGLREEGLLTVTAGVAGLRAVRLPARTRSRLRDELGAMSPPARHLLQAAATLRSPFPLTRLSRLLHAGPVTLLPAIDEVLESGLLNDDDLLRFSHDLVRPVVEASMPRSVVAALRDEQPRPAGRGSGPAAAAHRPSRARPAPDWSLLTSREREVAGFVGRALTNRQIASRINRSPHTVNFHLRQIFHKLGLTSRVELASLVRQRETPSGPSSS